MGTMYWKQHERVLTTSFHQTLGLAPHVYFLIRPSQQYYEKVYVYLKKNLQENPWQPVFFRNLLPGRKERGTLKSVMSNGFVTNRLGAQGIFIERRCWS